MVSDGRGPHVFRALRHPSFRRFYVGAVILQLGFWFSHIGFQALMADETDDEIWLSLLFVATFLPTLLLGPFFGVLADRFDRKRLLLGAYGAIGVTAAAQAILVRAGVVAPPALLVAAAVVGLGMAALGPFSGAAIANVTPQADLPSAISLQAMAGNGSRMIGPALAAPLVKAGVPEVAWGIYAAAAAVGIVVGSRLVLITDAAAVPEQGGMLQRIRAGLHHARERSPALPVIATVAVLSTFAVSHVALLPSFTAEALGREKSDFAFFVATTGAGAFAGALAAGSLRADATLRRCLLLALPYTMLLLAFSLVDDFTVALVLQAVIGFFYFAAFTSMQAVVQLVVADHQRGRVMSLFQIAWAGLVPLGTLLMGLAAGTSGLDLGPRTTLVVSSSLAVGWVVGMLVRDARGQRPKA